MDRRRCQHRMPDGTLCKAAPLLDEEFCLFHSPAHEEEAAEARRLGGLRRRREKTVAGAYGLLGLSTAPDIRRLLEVATLDTLSLENSVARSRTLAYLAQTALRCLEVGELEERVHALEGVVRGRRLSFAADFDLELDVPEEPDKRKELTA